MKKICKNIAFSPSGDCLLGEECICKINDLYIKNVKWEIEPDPFIEYLDSEIERYNKLRYLSEDEVSKFQFLGSASSLIDAKEKYSQLTQNK